MSYTNGKITDKQKQIIYDIEWYCKIPFTGKTYDSATEFIACYIGKAREEKNKRRQNTPNYRFRVRRGSEVGNAKLNEEKVREIKIKLRDGATYKSLAEEYDISTIQISRIKLGKAWCHVKIS